MAISTIYRVSHTLPTALTKYLYSNIEMARSFEIAIMQAQEHNCGAGLNEYTETEWAEFEGESHAIQCNNAMRAIITNWHNSALEAGF